MCSENRTEFAYVLFGTLCVGATFAPLNTTYGEREIEHAFSLSKPKIVFASPATIDKILRVTAKHSSIEAVVVFGERNEVNDDTVIDFKTFCCNANAARNFECQPQDVLENVSLILLSSGTTGQPKGVMITQYNIMVGLHQHFQQTSLLEDEHVSHPIYMGIIPWFHAFGSHSLVGIMINKATLVFLPKFEEVSFLRCIETYKTNTMFMVPPLMVFLAKSPVVSEYDTSSIKVIWCGAAPLSKEVEDAVKCRIGLPIVRQGYGMTEGTLTFTGQTDLNHKSGSVGPLRTGVWGRVVDVDTGENLKAFEKGELLFKGSCLMKGYIGDVKATKNTIDENGWIHTGDIGYYDNDGELFVVDRLKELIKYNGFQVPPAEIEALLLQHPDVRDAGVIGILDEKVGELPFAFVVKQQPSDVTEKDIIEFVAERSSPAKRLHGGVKFVKEIPKNPSGKILRRELRNLYTNMASKL
ncbi:hypothetical protein HA402_000351 [Bradysia odoriphaga]|nr:hypothetical protein HA402_000351 [Bradysia odoriphaga]